MFRLTGADSEIFLSDRPGAFGGHRRLKGYGRLDCPSALRWIARGHYIPHRVFFADEATAIAAGYRPCARCLPERYVLWKRDPGGFRSTMTARVASPDERSGIADAWPVPTASRDST